MGPRRAIFPAPCNFTLNDYTWQTLSPSKSRPRRSCALLVYLRMMKNMLVTYGPNPKLLCTVCRWVKLRLAVSPTSKTFGRRSSCARLVRFISLLLPGWPFQEAGNAAAAAQDWSSALKAWNEALSRNPPKDLAAKLHEQKAQVLLELGRTWEALKASALATECQPNWAPGYLTRGRAQLNYGEPELSIESLEMVLKLEPGGELAEAAAADLAAARVLVLQRRQREERDRGARVNTNDLKL